MTRVKAAGVMCVCQLTTPELSRTYLRCALWCCVALASKLGLVIKANFWCCCTLDMRCGTQRGH